MAVLSNSNTTSVNGGGSEKDATKTSTLTNTGSIGDECWYPVPVQTACDYYEQLEQILPTQYEILLRQIIRKYKLNEPMQAPQTDSTSTTIKPNMKASGSLYSLTNVNPAEYLHKILSSNHSESDASSSPAVFVNWKNVWDYFYQLAEARITKDLVDQQGTTNESVSFMHQQTPSNHQQQVACSIIRPYLSSIVTQPVQATGTKLQSQSSSSQCSQVSNTPPFPKVRESIVTHLAPNVSAGKFSHEFQTSLFSSVNVCKVCSTSFKSSNCCI
jgi:hypothetical protein